MQRYLVQRRLVPILMPARVDVWFLRRNTDHAGLILYLRFLISVIALILTGLLVASSGCSTLSRLPSTAESVSEPVPELADLVLAGVESPDGYTGTVPEMVAGAMDLPSITFAKQIAIAPIL